MFDSFINYLDKFGPEVLVIQSGFLVILSTLFLWLWFANRRKYHNLKHAIPANVVKNYLDSIIQNSTALKSSLFRGGGLDVTGVPSVMPLQGLGGGDNLAVSGAPSTALMEELIQKKALIASLESQLLSLQSGNKELEAKLLQSQNNLAAAEAKIRELEALLAKQRSGDASGDGAIKAELEMVIKERNEIRDRLREFEIISDDLANLKRLQQENAQLKKSLAAQGGSLSHSEDSEAEASTSFPQADVSDLLEDLAQSDESSGEDNKSLEDFLSSPDETSPESIETSEVDNLLSEEGSSNTEDSNEENKTKSEKTPEDLLSEFEKMLG